MSYGNMLPYLRSRFGSEGKFATGSLVFDLERAARRGDVRPIPHRKTARAIRPSQ